ncbi:dual specificity phosphatase 28-like isoform X1 [Sinocyclocheilus rhinocerous]|uniref:dual specificity phosphatase 28-like isoform X1 n=1 Tax=Sinocyclocheilus rhinocerous TaxID=307959 RepID=UPI0007BAC8A0|nr:PREDICTED: dual specificity phosphatase 28-like isoform X1 [Sinocyclocheilus rhinocerous]
MPSKQVQYFTVHSGYCTKVLFRLLFYHCSKQIIFSPLLFNQQLARLVCQPFPSMWVSTLRVPVYDDPQEDLYKYFDRCADAIASEAERGGRTVVYCKNGRSRSATVCVAYLMKHQGLTLTDAFQVVKSARSVVEPNPGFWTQLERYEQDLKIRRSASHRSNLPTL